MTILQMAQLAADQLAEGHIRVRILDSSEAHSCYAADTGLRLSGKKLKSLGWEPKESLADMYREMLEDIDKCDW